MANRASQIQDLTLENSFCWQHIRSENNTADVLSQGLSPNEFKQCELWWYGLKFLQQTCKFEVDQSVNHQIILPEEQTIKRVLSNIR